MLWLYAWARYLNVYISKVLIYKFIFTCKRSCIHVQLYIQCILVEVEVLALGDL